MAPFADAVAPVLVLLFTAGPSAAAIDDFEDFTKNVSLTLDGLLSTKTYDKRLRPDFGGPPTQITVNMHIKSMGPVHENEQYYLMDVYFRQSWVDGRLSWEVPGLEELSMSWVFLEKVWKPDTYFLNGKKSHLHRITSPNKFLRIRPDGTLIYSMRLTIVAKCKMHLKKFPLDTQKCPLVIGSFGYSSADLLYLWSGIKVTVEKNLEMAQYDLGTISTKENKFVRKGKDEYSVVQATFELKRTIGFFVLQIYVPCTLIVCCSWVSFWINPGDAPARVSLAVTTVLSITTMGFGGRAQLPHTSHATALDWWVIFCFAFAFAVMVEYAMINFTDKLRNDLRKAVDARKQAIIDKKAEKERKEQEKIRLEEARKTIPAIHIEVVQLMDEETAQVEAIDDGEDREEAQLLQNMSESKASDDSPGGSVSATMRLVPIAEFTDKFMTAPTRKKTLPAAQLLEVAGPSSFSPKRWRSVPNVLAPEQLGGKMREEWLREVEGRRRPPETWKEMLKRWALSPIVFWETLHLLPREEDVQEAAEGPRFSKIDIFARRFFPICFLIFILTYILLYVYYIVDDSLIQEEY